MGRVLVGCTGWGYEEWRGGFYPPGTPSGEFLEHYARVFRLAEIDSTYYHTPSREQAKRWDDLTPPRFLFAPKVPGRITHDAALRGVGDAFAQFLAALAPLRGVGKLGPVVLQFPATFTQEKDGQALHDFLAGVPSDVRLAVELRHASWWRPETYRLLESHRAALVWSENQYATTPPVVTADFAYLRLIGDRALTEFDRIQRDKRDSMARWAALLREHAADVPQVFALLNNHYMGFAPQTAVLFSEALGLPPPDLAAAGRGRAQRSLGDFG
jgi:uncharacterized protein YecE (DUF72 family)